MDLVYFILLISVLIFVHELGHFAMAKAFGVKVLVFSLGFGPKLIRLRGKETEYCVGILPFGGFVTMLEQNKGGARIPPEDRMRTFESQALWKRVLIVIAGPAMNVLFPIVLYTTVFLDDRDMSPAVVGFVVPTKPAFGKLMSGDRITEVEGTSVETYDEVHRIVAKRADVPTKFTIEREGKTLAVSITPSREIDEDDDEQLGITTYVGRVGFSPGFPGPILGVPRTDSPAFRAGLRTFDRVTAVNGRPVDRTFDLMRILSQNHGESVTLTYMRPLPQPHAMDGLCDIAVMEPGVVNLAPTSAAGDSPPTDSVAREGDVLARVGIEPTDMYVAYVPEGGSEWLAGLRAGDRITSLDGVPQLSWTLFQDDVKRGAGHVRKLEWTRGGQPMAGHFQLREEAWSDELGQPYEKYVFRTTHWVPLASSTVKNPHLYSYAIRRGISETERALQTVWTGFARLFQGKVSLRSVSGPMTIYDVAGRAGAQGRATFVWAMALISVNLGLINLLPLPVLDGGHLAFLLIEAARRKPISLRTREIASLVGMSLLVVLMLIAFKNDIDRSQRSSGAPWRDLFHHDP